MGDRPTSDRPPHDQRHHFLISLAPLDEKSSVILYPGKVFLQWFMHHVFVTTKLNWIVNFLIYVKVTGIGTLLHNFSLFTKNWPETIAGCGLITCKAVQKWQKAQTAIYEICLSCQIKYMITYLEWGWICAFARQLFGRWSSLNVMIYHCGTWASLSWNLFSC